MRDSTANGGVHQKFNMADQASEARDAAGSFSLLDLVVYGCILLFVFYDFVDGFRGNLSILVQMQFFAMEVLSLFFFLFDKSSYSIHKFLLLYLFVFEGFAPLQQYRSDSNLWGVIFNTDELYVYSNLLVFVFLLAFEFGYRYFRQSTPGAPTFLEQRMEARFALTTQALVSFVLLDLSAVLYLGVTGQLMGKVDSDGAMMTDTITAAVKIALQTVCIATLIVYVLMRREGRVTASAVSQSIYKGISIICIGLVYFPLWGSMSRFLLFAVYIMLVVLLYPRLRHPSLLFLAVFVGFAYVFPAFNFFKYHGFSDIFQFEFSNANFNFYDFDAHQCFMVTIDYTINRGCSWGMNILSSVLCFVPRGIWPAKWQPSGQVIFTDYGAPFANVSCPLYAEFFLAFGITGLVVLSILMGRVVKFVEESYDRGSILVQGVCVILIGMAIYIARGALLPTCAYTFSVIMSLMFAYFVAKACGDLARSGRGR